MVALTAVLPPMPPVSMRNTATTRSPRTARRRP
jgi:hypothetical protein